MPLLRTRLRRAGMLRRDRFTVAINFVNALPLDRDLLASLLNYRSTVMNLRSNALGACGILWSSRATPRIYSALTAQTARDSSCVVLATCESLVRAGTPFEAFSYHLQYRTSRVSGRLACLTA